MPRLFIAVDVSAEVKNALKSAQAPLVAERLPVRWTKPELMHLTLVFLGETDADYIARIGDALKQAVTSIRPHALQLGKLGAFPTLARPKVIWCGIEGATDELERFHNTITSAIEGVVPSGESRPYSPHLTIGRVRQDATNAGRRKIGSVLASAPQLPRLRWLVDEAALYESIPAQGGVQHVKLLAAPLGMTPA